MAELKEQLEQKRESKQKTLSAEDAAKLVQNEDGDDEKEVQLLRRAIAEKDMALEEKDKALEEKDNTINEKNNAINEREKMIATLRQELEAARDRETELKT